MICTASRADEAACRASWLNSVQITPPGYTLHGYSGYSVLQAMLLKIATWCSLSPAVMSPGM